MKTIPVTSGTRISVLPRSRKNVRRQKLVKAVAAPAELSPKEAGTEDSKNQLEAIKQMSKIVADSGVRLFHLQKSCSRFAYSCVGEVFWTWISFQEYCRRSKRLSVLRIEYDADTHRLLSYRRSIRSRNISQSTVPQIRGARTRLLSGPNGPWPQMFFITRIIESIHARACDMTPVHRILAWSRWPFFSGIYDRYGRYFTKANDFETLFTAYAASSTRLYKCRNISTSYQVGRRLQ